MDQGGEVRNDRSSRRPSIGIDLRYSTRSAFCAADRCRLNSLS